MAGRRRICLTPCLALASIFFISPFVNDLHWPSDDSWARLLAEDALRAGRDSVHEAMWTLLETSEDQLQTSTERNVINHSVTAFERLQASLDSLLQTSSLGNTALEELSVPHSMLKGRRVADMHHTDMCAFLAGKRITMIGGEHIYRLHVHLLQHRERVEGKPFPCQYHEFCTHHHICLPYQHFQDDIPPPRYIKSPTTQELIETESAVVKYVVSDTLFSAPNEPSWEYSLPFVDPMTGIRLRETYWLAAARKANVVILGRGPLSAPGQTYAGNWSFLQHVPDYVDISHIAFAGGYVHHDHVHMHQTVPRALEILNAAVHLTVSRFLPDVFRLLQSIRHEVRPSRQKRLIWPGSWYRLPGRGVARAVLLRPHARSEVQDWILQTFFHRRRPLSSAEDVLTLQLSALINADVTNTAILEDPWTWLFNAQVYLQNMVLRELLPRHSIVFLPLDIPWVQDTHTRGYGHGHYHGTTPDVDFERTVAIGNAFLTGMNYILGFLE